MDLNEAIKEIKSRVKPYAQINMPQSTFVNTLRNIEAGLAKGNTIEGFMNKFGYSLQKTESWEHQ